MKHYKEHHMFKSKKKSNPLDLLGTLKPKKKSNARVGKKAVVTGTVLAGSAAVIGALKKNQGE